MGGLDPAKILLILVVALVVLGPERLPRAARQLGAAWRELTHLRERVAEEVRAALPDLDLPPIPRNPAHAVTTFVTGLFADAEAGSATAPGTGEASTTPASDGAGEAVHASQEPVGALAPSGGLAGWSLVGARVAGQVPCAPAVPAAPDGAAAADGLELRLGDPGLN